MSAYTLDNDKEHVLLALGEPHPWVGSFERTSIGLTEGMKLAYDNSGINIVLVLAGDPDRDGRLLEENPLKFGLLRMQGGYCWVLHCGVGCFEGPYSPCIGGDAPRPLPWVADETKPRLRAFIMIHVVDRRGVVQRLNAVTVSPEFSRKLESLHAEAVRFGRISTSAWDAEISRHEARYPTPQAAMRQALVTSKGGA